MNIQMTAQIIQLILAPVVMISACGILLSGLVGRYTSSSSQLRMMTHERLELLREEKDMSHFKQERLWQLDTQLPKLLRHHAALHAAILALYWSIAIFVISMFAIALAASTNTAWLATGALLLFLVGTGTVLIGITLTAIDFRTTHHLIQYEVQRACDFGK
jgi:energy-coupling factor transporter transmembrane protein EcfT